MLREIRNLVAFLTIIPVGMDVNCIMDAAKYMYLFPLVGAFIGLIAGAFAWFLYNFFSPLLVGVLTLGLLLLITGLHHADGLLDFGDGLIYQGSAEEKIRVMRDQQTGAGGFTAGFITFSATILCIASVHKSLVIQSLIVSEASAKFTMVLMARLGKSAHEGMNKPFICAMHGSYQNTRLTAALIITSCIAFLLLRAAGLATIIAGIITALILVKVSERQFGGLTGDVFGAGNELARLGSLLAVLVAVEWT
ncbi:MAG: adenosylcobinamide-GDP ribazoletransferase [Candidatus Bathyarchaeia archaeon]